MDEAEIARLAAIVVDPINQGQSPFSVVNNHPELGICEKTLYTYITKHVFRSYGLIDLDLRQKVSRKRISKEGTLQYKKRNNRKYLKGRTYEDFCVFLSSFHEQETPSVVEMDTLYNHADGPFLQIFYFRTYRISFALFHESKTALSMTQGLKHLEDILTPSLFAKYVFVYFLF